MTDGFQQFVPAPTVVFWAHGRVGVDFASGARSVYFLFRGRFDVELCLQSAYGATVQIPPMRLSAAGETVREALWKLFPPCIRHLGMGRWAGDFDKVGVNDASEPVRRQTR
jgi:hypothetical protein